MLELQNVGSILYFLSLGPDNSFQYRMMTLCVLCVSKLAIDIIYLICEQTDN